MHQRMTREPLPSLHTKYLCVWPHVAVSISVKRGRCRSTSPIPEGSLFRVPKVLAQLLGRLRMSPTHHHTSLGLPRALSFRWYVAYSLSALSAGMIL